MNTLNTNFQIEAVFERPQLSLLKNEIGESSLAIQLVRLIVEVSKLVPYKGEGTPFSSWAKAIISQFYWIRFEEFSHILISGATGKYGREGKIYGELTLSFITEWIWIYDEMESQPFIIQMNLKKQGEYKQSMKEWNIDFKPFIESIGKKTQDEKNELLKKMPQTTSDISDEKQLTLFLAFGMEWNDIQLSDALEAAEKSFHNKTAQAISEEIKLRK